MTTAVTSDSLAAHISSHLTPTFKGLRKSWVGVFSKAMEEKRIFEENTNCPICLEDFQNEHEILVLPCKHAFHQECFKDWGPQTCPFDKESSGTSMEKVCVLGHSLLFPAKTQKIAGWLLQDQEKENPILMQALRNYLKLIPEDCLEEVQRALNPEALDSLVKAVIPILQNVLEAYEGKLLPRQAWERDLSLEPFLEMIVQLIETTKFDARRFHFLRKSFLIRPCSTPLLLIELLIQGSGVVSTIQQKRLKKRFWHLYFNRHTIGEWSLEESHAVAYLYPLFEKIQRNPALERIFQAIDRRCYLGTFQIVQKARIARPHSILPALGTFAILWSMGAEGRGSFRDWNQEATGPTSALIARVSTRVEQLDNTARKVKTYISTHSNLQLACYFSVFLGVFTRNKGFFISSALGTLFACLLDMRQDHPPTFRVANLATAILAMVYLGLHLNKATSGSEVLAIST